MGSRFPAVVSVTALRDAQNAIIGYLADSARTIPARKQIEAEQKQLAQRLRDQQFYTRSLFESNIDALMTFNGFPVPGHSFLPDVPNQAGWEGHFWTGGTFVTAPAGRLS